MLVKSLSEAFEITRVKSGDEVKHVPGMVLVSLAGLEHSDRIKNLIGTKIFLLGTQAEIDECGITGAEKFVRPFNPKEIQEKLSGVASQKAESITKTLLLVDDDAVMIRTLREGLSTSYKVIPANSGANALKIFARTKPDLILLDYEMPEMNGPQVLEALRSNPDTADIPVMFLTAKNDSDSTAKIEALKPQGYLLKTLPLREIKDKIQKFFDSK